MEDSHAYEAPPLEGILVETFDFLEVCCGVNAPLSAAMARAGLRVGPRVDIRLGGVFDVRTTKFILWVIFLITHDRVWYLHWAPTCTTFSLARNPRLRSHEQPMGFDPSEELTREGNCLLLRAILAMRVIALRSSRHGSLEQPKGAYSWSVEAMLALLSLWTVVTYVLFTLRPRQDPGRNSASAMTF